MGHGLGVRLGPSQITGVGVGVATGTGTGASAAAGVCTCTTGKIEGGGTKGKTLSTRVQQIYADFEGAINQFRGVGYDIMVSCWWRRGVFLLGVA